MTINEQKAAARTFAEQWAGRGDEKQETQTFWLTLLQKVFGVEDPAEHIQFELPVKIDHTSFIDAYLPGTRVLVEQKGCEVDLRKGYRQSDGSLLTPFQQARRYAGYLPHNQNPRWIVVCNFREFHIHDMNRPNDAPEVLLLSELEQQFHRLQFLVDTSSEHIKREMEVSIKAGELVGLLYDEILQQYKDPANPESLKSLNMLCVRLVFCLYAEDAGIFGRRSMFHDYLQTVADHDIKGVRRALIDLFRVLYLSVIRDLYDNSIVAYKTATSQTVNLVLDTIRLAIKKEKVAGELHLHSDQGFQYTSHGYFKLTQDYGITPSMSRRGNPYDNAMAENFFSILKTECIYRQNLKTFQQANQLIDEYIHFYNHERLQTKTGLAPLSLRQASL